MKWKIDEAEDLPLAIIEDDADGNGICEIGERTPRNIKNAQLMALSPELLDALILMTALTIKYWNLDADVWQEIVATEKLIKKAKGE